MELQRWTFETPVSCHRRPGPLHRPRREHLGRHTWVLPLLGALACRFDGDVLEPTPASASASLAARPPPPKMPHATHAEPASAPHGPRLALASLSRNELWAAWNSRRGDPYALDDVERWIDPATQLGCRPESLVLHRGQLLPYHGAVQVDPAFADRLVRFEQLVVEVAEEVYGRAPAKLRHVGAYSCRPTRQRSQRLSEHALGNAIDVIGFDFGRAKRGRALPAGVPSALSQAFQVRIARHWAPRDASSAAAAHARFLHTLADRLGDRSDVFRGMIGPSRRDHADHFHLDMSPWRYVWF